MNSFTYYAPTKVVFGRGAADKTAEQLKAFGAGKVLVVYGGGSAVKSGLIGRIEAQLKDAGIPYVLFGGAKPNPRLSLVYEGIDLCRREGIDFVLGVGGGSAIDTGKLIAAGVCYSGDLIDILKRKASCTAALPHGCVLTIAATGSEMSDSAVVTIDTEGGMLKRGAPHSVYNRPRFAIMDPELTYTLPPYQTASGATDIIMHTAERFFSPGGVNEMSDRIACQLIRTVIDYTPIALKEPDNYDARSEIMWAGSLSHNDLTGLGRKGDWAAHQLEHALGGVYDVAHGAGLAAVWASWARYVLPGNEARFARYAHDVFDIDVDITDPKKAALAGIKASEDFFRDIGMPVTIRELIGHTPDEEELKKLVYECTYRGTRAAIGALRVLNEEDMFAIFRMAAE